MNATAVVCPACNAQVGEPCTAPTDTSRRNVSWFHYSRVEAAQRRAGDEGEPNG